MKTKPITIPAGEFKAKCLRLMEQAKHNNRTFIITKHGEPVALLIPANEQITLSPFGYLKGSVKINGNILKPIEEEWDADA